MCQLYFKSISYEGESGPDSEKYPEHPHRPLHNYIVTLEIPGPNLDFGGGSMRVALEVETFSLSLDEARVEAIRRLKGWISDLSEAIEEAERDFSLR